MRVSIQEWNVLMTFAGVMPIAVGLIVAFLLGAFKNGEAAKYMAVSDDPLERARIEEERSRRARRNAAVER